jgi:hypothetical protein
MHSSLKLLAAAHSVHLVIGGGFSVGEPPSITCKYNV